MQLSVATPLATPVAHVPVPPHVLVAQEPVYPQKLTLSCSLDKELRPGSSVGQLRAGMPVKVMDEESLGHVCIRFTLSTGLCKAAALKSDLDF